MGRYSDSKNLIEYMGFKHIEANGEADKLCAALVRKIKYMAC